ncbi:MAG: hypothetical protein CL529_12110 [Aequorivita sp.]|nr:hypothetical protein [Aequorivita sp.]|tara:strand:+ start:13537 stop:14631 length:1095 start_codon:yes stop_codon:yes gene_type:complete
MKKRTTEFFIFVFTALAFSYFSQAEAGTCSSISRSSFGANTVLTSAELNNQFSTVYSATNDLDAGCLTDGTLEASALDATEFQPLLNHVTGGCLVSRSSVSAVSIGPCSMSVNGKMVYKNSPTVVSMGCGDCSAETASTTYYVYVKGDSTGSTINAFLSTVAPDTFGLNGTAKVLAVARNDSASDLYEYGIDQWRVNAFTPTHYGWVDGGTITVTSAVTAPTKGSNKYSDKISWSRQGTNAVVQINYDQLNVGGGTAGLTDYIFDLPTGITWKDGTNFNNTTVADIDYSGGINLNQYDAGTGFYSYGYGIAYPYSETQFKIYVSIGKATGGTDPTSFNVGSNVFRFDEQVTIRGKFTVPADAFQ